MIADRSESRNCAVKQHDGNKFEFSLSTFLTTRFLACSRKTGSSPQCIVNRCFRVDDPLRTNSADAKPINAGGPGLKEVMTTAKGIE